MTKMMTQENKKKISFILEDEVEGMMAEDKNVLIKAEQNKKKFYLPTELWDIVKSYALYPTKVHQAIEIKCKQAVMIEWSDQINIWRASHCYTNLKNYIHRNNKKYNDDHRHPNYMNSDWQSFKRILASRASTKTKDEVLSKVSSSVKWANKKYEERKQYHYGNSEFAVSFRKLHSENDYQELPLPRWTESYEETYNDYLDARSNNDIAIYNFMNSI